MTTTQPPIELHTWSGRRHKFNPVGFHISDYYGSRYQALCNASISTSDRALRDRKETSLCKRCFPAVAS